MFAVQSLEAPGDLKTLQHWARYVGVSYTSLCETCRLLDIRPHAARDFCRVLRAVIESQRHGCPPEVLLNVSDRRTIATMFDRAGITRDRARPDVNQFLRCQRFIPPDNEALIVLRGLIARRHTSGGDSSLG